MRKLYLNTILFIAAISLTVLSSCRFGCIKGSGNQVTENRKGGDFNRIEIDGGFKVVLKQDSSLNLSIHADDNLMKYIRSSVSGGRLKIYSKRKFCGSGEVVLTIGIKNLEEVKTSGGINLSTDGKLNTKDLHLDFSGAAKVDMDLNAANLTTEGSGSTEMELRGQATSHNVDLTGSGKIHALDFVVGKYDVHTTGASECEINVLNELEVNTTGAADIKYRGNPTKVNSSKTGAANIQKIE